jgi:hypothetical protein
VPGCGAGVTPWCTWLTVCVCFLTARQSAEDEARARKHEEEVILADRARLKEEEEKRKAALTYGFLSLFLTRGLPLLGFTRRWLSW